MLNINRKIKYKERKKSFKNGNSSCSLKMEHLSQWAPFEILLTPAECISKRLRIQLGKKIRLTWRFGTLSESISTFVRFQHPVTFISVKDGNSITTRLHSVELSRICNDSNDLFRHSLSVCPILGQLLIIKVFIIGQARTAYSTASAYFEESKDGTTRK